MEGAGVGFAANRAAVPFVEIRAISNIAGVADRARWDKAKACDTLTQDGWKALNALLSAQWPTR